jgi:hypothetical protein
MDVRYKGNRWMYCECSVDMPGMFRWIAGEWNTVLPGATEEMAGPRQAAA